MGNDSWDVITPQVHAEAEFYEILNDFGNPLEILREAISNSIDYNATYIKIEFVVGEIEGNKRLIINLEDDGEGMDKETLARDFWGLGYSRIRQQKIDAIGEKGHGTKIYLRSEQVTVKTRQKEQIAFESVCERPLSALSQKKLHSPKIREIDSFDSDHGTHIQIVGYNDNERSKFIQEVVKDYILWFTKVGSVEKEFGLTENAQFKVHLKCIDKPEYEEIPFGHIFPEEDSDINKLFEEKGTDAADWYVKKFMWDDARLKKHPEVTYQAVVYVEGDEAKRNYNKMIRERRRSDTGRYRVADRYGLWLCKDYIPVARVNDWITGFGSGSNAFVLLHGFINCQDLKLTANRGTIANTDPQILEELRDDVQDIVSEVDSFVSDKGINILKAWQEEQVTLKQETSEFTRRIKNLTNRCREPWYIPTKRPLGPR